MRGLPVFMLDMLLTGFLDFIEKRSENLRWMKPSSYPKFCG